MKRLFGLFFVSMLLCVFSVSANAIMIESSLDNINEGSYIIKISKTDKDVKANVIFKNQVYTYTLSVGDNYIPLQFGNGTYEFEIFENICRMSQKQLHKGLKDIFSDMYGQRNVIDKEKYLYVRGTTPVLLVAHLDTVFKTPNRGIYFDPEKNIIWGGATGLGADDRAGVFGIIWLISSYEFRPHILFVEDEEIGGHGYLYHLQKHKQKQLKNNMMQDAVILTFVFVKYVENGNAHMDFGLHLELLKT